MILLAPSKTMHEASKVQVNEPLFNQKAVAIMEDLKMLDSQELANYMNIKGNTLMRTYTYIEQWGTHPHYDAAIHLYKGVAFKEIDAKSYTASQKGFAQTHLRILSALYGILKPYDDIQPYRLDFTMSHRLYKLWRHDVTTHLIQAKPSYILSLASDEFNKMIDLTMLKIPFIHVHFIINGKKAGTSFTKSARGALADAIVRHQYDHIDDIITLKPIGYQYDPVLSNEQCLVFSK